MCPTFTLSDLQQDIFNLELQKLLNYDFEIWATLPRVQRRSKVTASLCIFTVSDKCIQSDPEREPGMRKERYSTTSYSCNTFSPRNTAKYSYITYEYTALYFSTIYVLVLLCSSSMQQQLVQQFVMHITCVLACPFGNWV